MAVLKKLKKKGPWAQSHNRFGTRKAGAAPVTRETLGAAMARFAGEVKVLPPEPDGLRHHGPFVRGREVEGVHIDVMRELRW